MSAAVLLGSSLPGLEAESRPGIVRVQILNGTTGEAGQAEWATLYHLASGMDPVASAQNVSGRFILEGFGVEANRPYLLQVTYGGVNYNEMLRFGSGSEAEATITVYDVTREWNDVEVKSARFIFRREHDRLRVDKRYVVENKTEPKQTFYDPEGSFRFQMPSLAAERSSISASSPSGMPIPQSASPLSDGSGYVTQTAFKPGTTHVTISYDVDYSSGGYRLEEKALYPLAELSVLVAPPDIEVEAGNGWENLGPEPQGRFIALRRTGLDVEAPVALTFSGGSEHAAQLAPSPAGSENSSSGAQASPQVVTLRDPTRAQKWIVALLMGAALTYGLLTVLVPTPEARPAVASRLDGLQQSLANLERRRAGGEISAKSYRKKKRDLHAKIQKGGSKNG